MALIMQRARVLTDQLELFERTNVPRLRNLTLVNFYLGKSSNVNTACICSVIDHGKIMSKCGNKISDHLVIASCATLFSYHIMMSSVISY